MLDINALPNDIEDLKRLVLEHHAASAAKDVELGEQRMLIEHLRFQLAKLRRARFGQSSEQLEGAGQLAMSFEELRAAVADAERQARAAGELPAAEAPKGKPVRRKKLPEHFERLDNLIEPKECTCPDCGGPLSELGRDESELLEVKTVTFTVTRHIRPKKRCTKCSAIVQALAPSRPIEKSFAGASLLALILTWKYGFALPSYRQCQIFAHAGLKLSRTTLMQWVAGSSKLLGPLVGALAKHVLSAANLNADDTPFRVLAPGTARPSADTCGPTCATAPDGDRETHRRCGTSTPRAGMESIRRSTWPASRGSCRSMATRGSNRCFSPHPRGRRRACRRFPAWRIIQSRLLSGERLGNDFISSALCFLPSG